MASIFDNGGIIGPLLDVGSTDQYIVSTIPANTLGLTTSFLQLSGVSAVYTQHSIDLSAYVGDTIRFVWKHAAGPSYQGDLQVDYIQFNSGSVFNFETTADGFETTTVNSTDYSVASFSAVATSTLTARWNRDTAGTPSTGTGLTTAANGAYYLYSETTTVFNATRFLRSPEIVLTSGTFTFYEARSGLAADLGTLDFYIDVVSSSDKHTYGNYKNSGIWNMNAIYNAKLI